MKNKVFVVIVYLICMSISGALFILLVITAWDNSCPFTGGCGGDNPYELALLLFILTALIIIPRIFNIRRLHVFIATLLPIILIVCGAIITFVISTYQENARHNQLELQMKKKAQEDYPYIKLQEPFTLNENNPQGTTELFLHIPFSVNQSVESTSFYFLTKQRDPNSEQLFYENFIGCDIESIDPEAGYHVIDTSFSDFQQGFKLLSRATALGNLEIGRTYYLLKWISFYQTNCKIPFQRDLLPWKKLSPIISDRLINDPYRGKLQESTK